MGELNSIHKNIQLVRLFQKNFWNKDLELNIRYTHCVPGKTYKQQSASRYILVKLQNVNDK